MSVSVAKFR
jgi:hypothetical protein